MLLLLLVLVLLLLAVATSNSGQLSEPYSVHRSPLVDTRRSLARFEFDSALALFSWMQM